MCSSDSVQKQMVGLFKHDKKNRVPYNAEKLLTRENY
jgi:hypothetical protein